VVRADEGVGVYETELSLYVCGDPGGLTATVRAVQFLHMPVTQFCTQTSLTDLRSSSRRGVSAEDHRARAVHRPATSIINNHCVLHRPNGAAPAAQRPRGTDIQLHRRHDPPIVRRSQAPAPAEEADQRSSAGRTSDATSAGPERHRRPVSDQPKGETY